MCSICVNGVYKYVELGWKDLCCTVIFLCFYCSFPGGSFWLGLLYSGHVQPWRWTAGGREEQVYSTCGQNSQGRHSVLHRLLYDNTPACLSFHRHKLPHIEGKTTSLFSAGTQQRDFSWSIPKSDTVLMRVGGSGVGYCFLMFWIHY